MVSKEGLKQRLYEELASVLEANTAVSNPYEHVAVHNTWEDEVYPSYVYETFGRPHSRGIDGSVHVDEIEYSGGEIAAIIYRKDSDLIVDISAFTDDGAEKQKDQLYQSLEDNFSEYNMWKDPSDFHSDVRSIDVGGTSDVGRADEAIRGDRLRIEMEYSRYRTFDTFVPIRKVEQSFEHTTEEHITTN